jgi:predicted acyltransferase (DUF342 family)
MTTVSNLPLAALSNLGTVKATGLQLHTIRQVSTINAPNLTGTEGDLILDSGVHTRGNNGRVKIKGGYEGAVKIDVLEAGVWDKSLAIGQLTSSTVNAQTIAEHLSVGTLITGVKIPILGSETMDVTKVYALRNVGTTGHVAWASINDIGGDLKVSGKLSVSSDTFLAQDLSVGGNAIIDGSVLLSQSLSVAGNVKTDSSLSVGGRLDLGNQLTVTGVAILNNSLSVASNVTTSDSLSVGTTLIVSDVVLSNNLSVGNFAQFESHISVSADISLNDLHVRGRIFPFSNGLSVSGEIVFPGTLSVNAEVVFDDKLSVGGDTTLAGANLHMKGATSIILGESTTEITVEAASLLAIAPLRLQGHLSVGNASAILFDTPMLSVQGSIFSNSDATYHSKLNLGGDLSCGSSLFLGSAITVGTTADISSDLAVGGNLSVNGAITIVGDLDVQGTTTTISSTILTVEDKTLELGVVDAPSDGLANGAGLIIKGSSDKSILYTRSASTSATTQQLSAFQLSEDLVLGKKSKPYNEVINSKLTSNPRSQVLHLGDINSTDGHWMIVSDITQGTLQFWYGQDISDDQTLDAMSSLSAKLAFELQKPL